MNNYSKGFTKEYLQACLAEGWDERREKHEKRRLQKKESVKRWRACEQAIDVREKELGRTLTVEEYKSMKIKFGINPQ